MSNKNNKTESLRSKMQTLKSVHLTEQEQSAMKSQLLSYVDLHAAPERTAGILSPFTYKSIQYSSRVVFSGALVVLLLVGTTGVSFAAENTLPGEPLYAVKVNVNEPIEGAVISVTSGEAGEAEWQNTLAERRLQEAAMLADRNELASSTQEYLAQQVAIHVTASQEDSATLEESGATSTALQTQTDLDARLSAHAQILALLANKLDDSGNASTTVQVAVLLRKIRVEQQIIAVDASSTELALASSTVPEEMTPRMATSSTPMLAIDTQAQNQMRVEEAHIFRQELKALNLMPTATFSSTTASSSESVASSTEASSTEASSSASLNEAATSTEQLKAKILELLKQ